MATFYTFPNNYRTDIDRNFTVINTVETATSLISDNNYETNSDATSFTCLTHGILSTCLLYTSPSPRD